MKKIVALLLALVMTLSLGTVAFAEGEGTEKQSYQMTIKFVANVTAKLLQYPAQYVAPSVKDAGTLVAEQVDEICTEINKNVGQALAAVQDTMDMTLRVVGAANYFVSTAKNILSWFGMEESLSELEAIMKQVTDYSGTVFAADENLSAFLAWIAPTEADDDGERTVAGEYVLEKFEEAYTFLANAKNFTEGVGNGPVATFLYELMVHYYTAAK